MGSFVYSGGSSLADSALRKSADGNVFYTQQGHWWTVGLKILGFTNTEMTWSVRMSARERGNNRLPASTQLLLKSLPVLRLLLIRWSSLTKTIELNPVARKPVVFELYETPPGVPHVKDGGQNWTPVVQRRERKDDDSKERTGSCPKNCHSGSKWDTL